MLILPVGLDRIDVHTPTLYELIICHVPSYISIYIYILYTLLYIYTIHIVTARVEYKNGVYFDTKAKYTGS